MTARFLALYETPTDPEAFDKHYREIHIPLALRVPGLRRYTIGRDATGIRGGTPYYLIAELEWDTVASCAPRSPPPKAAPRPPTRHTSRNSPRYAA